MKLTDKQGAQVIDSGHSRYHEEEEVGNCRPSPQSRGTPKPIGITHGHQEMTFEKQRSSGTNGGDISPIQDYTTNKAESQTYSLSNIVNG